MRYSVTFLALLLILCLQPLYGQQSSPLFPGVLTGDETSHESRDSLDRFYRSNPGLVTGSDEEEGAIKAFQEWELFWQNRVNGENRKGDYKLA